MKTAVHTTKRDFYRQPHHASLGDLLMLVQSSRAERDIAQGHTGIA